ncbi:iron permease FTR1 family protein [Diaporthe eres]|uniref:Plasma membrane iron permease n=1 Tax=Diaporthe vaccinii TaxID=105482 RepID=A0ABR4F5M0_9PEZI|nr:iron permease FTR1 family protein [Diaporthe eres]
MAPQVFAVPVFLVVFRETLETVIIVSVLLAWLKQTLDGPERDAKVYKKLRRQVWAGTGLGFFICLVVAAAVIGTFYTVGVNNWETSELYYEGAFALFAAIIITVVGAALLRISKMQEKWRVKLAAALEGPVVKTGTRFGWLKNFSEKYALFILPFITVLREGIEAIIFVAGVSFSAPATAFPLPAVVGLLVGILVGYILYKSGSSAKMQLFLVVSTCLLYLVAAGLFSRAVGYFEQQEWNNIVGGDAAELGTGPGSYDVDKAVWHVNCCSPEFNGGGGWGIFNAILGWNNTGTYGSVIAYNVYWIFVIASFIVMRFKEVKGHWPFMKPKHVSSETSSESGVNGGAANVQGGKRAETEEKSVAAS